jgi:hypothetical protein
MIYACHPEFISGSLFSLYALALLYKLYKLYELYELLSVICVQSFYLLSLFENIKFAV